MTHCLTTVLHLATSPPEEVTASLADNEGLISSVRVSLGIPGCMRLLKLYPGPVCHAS